MESIPSVISVGGMEPSMQSPQIDQIAAALAVVQGGLKNPEKGATNPFFHSKYAPLDVVLEAVLPPLSQQGLALIQTTTKNGQGVVLRTTLAHKSGQWIAGEYPIMPAKPDPQGWGSAVTYARRYTAAAIVGLAPKDEDDDGNEASRAPGVRSSKPLRETNGRPGASVSPPQGPPPGGSPAAVSQAEANLTPTLAERRVRAQSYFSGLKIPEAAILKPYKRQAWDHLTDGDLDDLVEKIKRVNAGATTWDKLFPITQAGEPKKTAQEVAEELWLEAGQQTDGDEKHTGDLIEQCSSFEGKDGKMIKGFRDPFAMAKKNRIGWLESTLGKLRKLKEGAA